MKPNFISKSLVTLLIFGAILTSGSPSQAAQLIIRAIECKSVSTGISPGVLNAIFKPLAAVTQALISTALPGDLSEASKLIAAIPDVAQAIDSAGGGDPDDLYLSLSNQPKRDLAVYNPDEGNIYVVEYEVTGVAVAPQPAAQPVGQQWQEVPGCAKKIASGGGRTWVLGCASGGSGGYQIFSRNGSNWDLVEGAATDIAVNSDGTPWVVNANGTIFQRSGNSWQPVAGCAKKIADGGDKVWVLGCANNGNADYEIFSRNGSNWDLVPGAAVEIAVDATGNPWVVNAAGMIYRAQ